MHARILSLTLALTGLIATTASAAESEPLPSSRLVKIQAIAPMPAGAMSPLGESQLVMSGLSPARAEKDLVLVLVFDPVLVKQRWVTQVNDPTLIFPSGFACMSGEGKAARVNSLPGPAPSCDAGTESISFANDQ
jgi:hypothetical protein